MMFSCVSARVERLSIVGLTPGLFSKRKEPAHSVLRFFCAVESISLILLSWFTSLAPGS